MAAFFDSRDTFYKDPFGAVVTGTEVYFTCVAPEEWQVKETYLCVQFEFDGETGEFPLTFRGHNNAGKLFQGVLSTVDRLGPLWYHFKLIDDDGHTFFYVNNESARGGEGVTSAIPHPVFQLTVYEDIWPAPEWYGTGVTYHIFPDRFHRTKVPDPGSLVGDRVVHADWKEHPVYLPDNRGEIRNRDFFGGSLAGVTEKLPYLESLGVTTIYFSPIFEAASNHRYDTADYHAVDPMFGTTEEFTNFCAEAAKLGMRVILDGVFSHTGFDSRYFNGRGTYPELGAYQSEDSPYYAWYHFFRWPDDYSAWWGIYTLPQLNETHPGVIQFLLEGKNSVVRHWLRAGASGFRLDVADELPSEFLEILRRVVKEENKDAVIIGEVWEDASHKMAYDVRRRYFLGRELDGVMNYPLRDALLHFALNGHAEDFKEKMECLRENYPQAAYRSLMNIVGTHDTPRVLTVLGADWQDHNLPKTDKESFALPPAKRRLAADRLKMISLLLYAFPGSPTVYYGDEAGMEGFEDPFNRRTFPWGAEDEEILSWYRQLGDLRRKYETLQKGDIFYLYAKDDLLCFSRIGKGERIVVAANRSQETQTLCIPWPDVKACNLLTEQTIPSQRSMLTLTLPPVSAQIWK